MLNVADLFQQFDAKTTGTNLGTTGTFVAVVAQLKFAVNLPGRAGLHSAESGDLAVPRTAMELDEHQSPKHLRSFSICKGQFRRGLKTQPLPAGLLGQLSLASLRGR